VESIQAFIFYLMQYSLSNICIFFIIILIGYSLVYYNKVKSFDVEEMEIENSPIQLIKQLTGYFHLNSLLALSLAIILFSFMGVPPLIGFFAKQLVLSAALNNGYYFLSLVGILTSVIGAVYYLTVVKTMFFEKPVLELLRNFDYVAHELNDITMVKIPTFKQSSLKVQGDTGSEGTVGHSNLSFLVLSSSLTIVVGGLTLITLIFILYPQS
jgi:NADH-ubiquinone oxidoreductase chain 2